MAGAAAGLPDWPTLLGSLDLTGAARPLAAHCVLLGHERGVVRLALDPRSTVVRRLISSTVPEIELMVTPSPMRI